MLITFLSILAIYSVAFIIRDSSLLDVPRNWLLQRSPFFFKMLDCSFCTGIHAGWICYLITNPLGKWSVSGIFLWALAGGPINLIMTSLVDKLYRQEDS